MSQGKKIDSAASQGARGRPERLQNRRPWSAGGGGLPSARSRWFWNCSGERISKPSAGVTA